jgi:(2R)-ethylmalonyl-CoA mutase
MNTSMTINATPRGSSPSTSPPPTRGAARRETLQGTTQNDIIKEYLSRGTYVFPPKPSCG